MSEVGTVVNFDCILEEQEIRGVGHLFPSGLVEGYQWRLLVSYPATATMPSRTEWTPWVFGSHQTVELMLQQWKEYLAKGHLAQAKPPGSTAH